MAAISRYKTKWRAQIYRGGVRKSKTFPTKREAQDWAAREEWLLDNGDKVAAAMTLGAVIDRYAREVSPTKRGARWEIVRLERMQRDEVAGVALGDLDQTHFAAWRDRRLAQVSAGSVLRELNLISAVLTRARVDWGLMTQNPLAGVRRPPAPRPRDRLPTADEFERLAICAGDDLGTLPGRAHHAFLFACETAMRAGEIVGLVWGRVHLGRRVVHLEITKNGTARDVPLSSRAVELLEMLPAGIDPVFGLKSAQLDSHWRRLCDRAMVTGLTFHDSRHYAITKLSRKLDVLALARVVGHRDLKQLMTYYNESAEDLARRLD